MKKSYNTIISNTRFSSGTSVEKKLKFFATIILIICVLLLIVTQYRQ